MFRLKAECSVLYFYFELKISMRHAFMRGFSRSKTPVWTIPNGCNFAVITRL